MLSELEPGTLLLLHVVTSLAGGLISTLLMPRQYRTSLKRTCLLHTMLALFIPLLGAVAMVVLSLYARAVNRLYHERAYRLVRLPVYTAAAREPSSSYGAGSVHSRLINPQLPKEVRLKALLTVQAMPGNLSTQLLRNVLSDPSDDLRLTAYGMLDKGEKQINQQIQDALKRLGENPDATADSEIHKHLASNYWELVYQGYAQGELKHFALDSAMRHVRTALQLNGHDADLWVMKGRIALAQHDSSLALAAFRRAEDLSMPHSRIRPFLAELAFQQRDFKTVRKLIGSIARHESNFVTAPLLAFWQKGSAT